MIETKFNLGDKVRIKELEADGVIMVITQDYLGIGYRVRYFNQGKPEDCCFMDWELEKRG